MGIIPYCKICYATRYGLDLTLRGAGMKATTHIILMATCLMLLATDRAIAVDCAAIRAACVERCVTVFRPGATQQSQTAQEKNCVNRCSIASCQETPLAARLCDATAQSLCTSSFRSCSDACIVSFAATAATIQSQASCTTSCCTKFKLCLGQRQCDLRGIIATTCEEGTSVLAQ
jgi:hypothetical protein